MGAQPDLKTPRPIGRGALAPARASASTAPDGALIWAGSPISSWIV
jgi:hypothetical protein